MEFAIGTTWKVVVRCESDLLRRRCERPECTKPKETRAIRQRRSRERSVDRDTSILRGAKRAPEIQSFMRILLSKHLQSLNCFIRSVPGSVSGNTFCGQRLPRLNDEIVRADLRIGNCNLAPLHACRTHASSARALASPSQMTPTCTPF